jgi:Tfp pilus assembly protein PilV
LKKFQYKTRFFGSNSIGKDTSAFTMVEIIISLAILSTSMLAVFGVLSICLVANNQSMMLTKSALLAENLLSETSLKMPISYQTVTGSEGLFNWQVQIAPTEMDNLAAVCIKVEWRQQQRQMQYELLSLLCIQSQIEGK